MDNRKLKVTEIEVLRKRAIEAVIVHGETQKRASQLFGFSPTSMCKYLAEYKRNGDSGYVYQKRGVKPGTHSKLTEDQLSTLIDITL